MSEENPTVEEETVEEQNISFSFGEEAISPICLVGEINDENTSAVISALVMNKVIAEKIEEPEPMEFYLNSEGGSAYEMFAIYDVMKSVQDAYPIKTIGIGKIMSAGVLILAAGTKGQRYIGRNSRVMIHNVLSGQQGSITTIQNEFNEVKEIQRMYIAGLVECSNLTERELKKMLSKNQNIYISAEKAIEYGLADHLL